MIITDPAPLFRGGIQLRPALGAPRLDTEDRRLPADTADTATIPAGMHLAFRSCDRRFVVHFDVGEPHPFSPPTRPDTFTLWLGDRVVASAVATAGSPAVLELEGEASVSDSAQEFVLHLPEALRPSIHAIESERAVEPVDDHPLVFAYGDSIVQGWSTSDPGLAWTARVGRMLGAEVCNLGFAGAARGEVAVAEQLAASPRPPAAVVLAFGTNAWTFPPTTRVAIAEALRIFLTTIRDAWPSTRIVFVSPIVRPDADDTPNRLGATLNDLREALESAAAEYADVALVRGLQIMTVDELVDGIHPGDEGHELLAQAIANAIGPLR
ncbi:GDSL-type esterase/lipase family protein [Microbacterium sp. LWH7-1.2]|uniref:GDSL-type esterase/lipase family protein n=1 Tax=Microbacterium sp. LWH7-1.2 TaxID=3135257 RepID=UPI00313A3286